MHDAELAMIVCRCEEITMREILQAIEMGAVDINGVKRRTRAGMGACQGRTCERLISQIIRQRLSESPEKIGSATPRIPTQLVSLGTLAGEEADVLEPKQ